MFTKNYINLTKGRFFCTMDSSMGYQEYRCAGGDNFGAYNKNLFYSDIGGYFTTSQCRVALVGASSDIRNVGGGVYFGTGSTPPAKSDYRLESPITSGLSVTNPDTAVQTSDGKGKYEVMSTFTVKNTTSSEIVIREMGIITPVRDLSTSGTFYYAVLMERTVLTDPIVIPAGGTKMITYKLTFNQGEDA